MDNQFKSLEGHMPVGCQLNVASAEEHVGLIERYINTLKNGHGVLSVFSHLS